jgi:predicted metal-dependent phosphoesterase TrpH
MPPVQTRVLRLNESAKELLGYSTAISLHSHTLHSRESLEYLPMQAERIPIVGSIIRRELREYAEGNGKPFDFRRAWWTPPVSAAQVYASERQQMEGLGFAPFVSITDHDSIAAGMGLRQQAVPEGAPISVEWTVPMAGDHLHVGVHNLPMERAATTMAELMRCTADPVSADLRELLAMLAGCPETLIVLNHPCWDVARVGAAEHAAAVRQFLALGGEWVHALEVNGLRSSSENRAALRMARELGMPTVAGGDRHGCRPNAVLNVTRAGSFAEFAEEVRRERRSEVLILPRYEEPLALRQLQTVADAVRYYPHHPHGRRRFTSRTFVDLEGYSAHPLSFYWDGGEPWWLKPPLALIVALGTDRAAPLLRRTVFRRRERDLMVSAPLATAPPAAHGAPMQA